MGACSSKRNDYANENSVSLPLVDEHFNYEDSKKRSAELKSIHHLLMNSPSKSDLNFNSNYMQRRASTIINGYIRKLGRYIPQDVINICFDYYFVLCTYLRFSKKWRSKPRKEFKMSLLDDGYTLSIKHSLLEDTAWAYSFVDTEPVTHGIHCWRFEVIKYINSTKLNKYRCFKKHPTTQIKNTLKYPCYIIAVCAQESIIEHYQSENDQFFRFKHLYGYTPWKWTPEPHTDDNSNMGWQSYTLATSCKGLEKYEIDLFFDIDTGYINICHVGQKDKTKHVAIWNIPTDTVKNWIPYFAVTTEKFQLKCKKIPTDYYGKHIDVDQNNLSFICD